MSFFKRNKDKNLIPPPQSAQASRDELLGSRSGNSTSPRPPNSYPRSTATTYVPSRDGDPYNGPSSVPPPPAEYGDRYARQNTVGDVYSRGQRDIDTDRSELFSGYNPQKAGSGRFLDDGPAAGQGPPRRGTPPPGEENEEDVEGIKQSMRYLKQDSVNSTRNALRLAREAEETARNTVSKLGSQSEKLADTERHLDVSKGHSLRAEDKTDELKQLNRSIFRPVITFNKDAKRAAQEAKIQARYEEDRLEREKAMRDIRETQDRLGRATTYGMRGDEEGIGGGSGSGRFRTAAELQARKSQRSRYQFEADEEDDQLEDELDDNLDEIADVSKRLKALGMAMGSELDTQNERLTRITDKADKLDFDLYRNTQKLNRIK